MANTTKRLILFDIDGTLLRTKGVGRKSTEAAMLEVFGTASTIATHHFGGKTDWYTLVELLKPHGYDTDKVGVKMADFVAAMERHVTQFIVDFPALALDGALDVVHRLRTESNSILGIVTGNAPTSARLKLQSAGFDPAWFPVGAFGSESVDRDDLPKLAIERAREHCGCEIGAVYVIGDTVMDIKAARAVDAVAIAVKTGFEDLDALVAAKPDHLLGDLTTLFDVL